MISKQEMKSNLNTINLSLFIRSNSRENEHHCAKKNSNHHANQPLEMYSFTL